MKKTLCAFCFALLLASSAGIGTASAQTGDQLVDDIIAGFAHKAGNSTTSSNLDLAAYTNPIACNSPSAAPHENNCPSDVTYSPSSYTGGGQTFGVGMTNYPGGVVLYAIPYLVYEPYWDTNCDCYLYHWVVYWDLYLVEVPPITRGVAAAAVTWGEDPYTPLHPSIPLSTMAFKYNGLVDRCDPTYTGREAPCGGNDPESDVTYIDGAGYEDKLYIQEACSLSDRTDTINDAYAGCFISLEGWTTLPSPVYLDTTSQDDGPTFTPGVGMVGPYAIEEGTKYYWYIYFGAYGNEPIVGQTAQHRNAITYRIGYSPFCLAFESVFGHAACYFNVDNTPLSPAAQIQ
ncbi:MAG TPA: hypothetical protein VF339_18925 [Gammaproteobacteria bacterium]